MSKPKKDRTVVVMTASFKFPMTEDEAYEILKNKGGKIAKKFRVYMDLVLKATAKKCLEEAKITKERIATEEVMKIEVDNEETHSEE